MIKRIIKCVAVLGSIALGVHAASAQSQTAKPGEIVVGLPEGASIALVNNLAAQAGCELINPVAYCPGFFVLGVKGRETVKFSAPVNDATKQAINLLKLNSEISSATPNWIFTKDQSDGSTRRAKSRVQQPPSLSSIPNDNLYARQKWHMELIRAPEAWNIQFMSDPANPVKVAVVDSGIDRAHPDFIDPATGQSKVVAAGDFIEGSPDTDGDGHGTHVAGTIAATTNNSTGVSGVGGWNNGGVRIQLIAAKGLNSVGGGTEASVASAIGFAISSGARAINASLGFDGTQPSDVPLISAQVARAISNGIIFCATAGNVSRNANLGILRFPGDLPGVFKVTAVGRNSIPASYSNYGGGAQQFRIAGPGGAGTGDPDDVISTWPTTLPSGIGVPGYNSIAGTSMACPHVTGCVAVMLAAGAPSSAIWNDFATTVSPIKSAGNGVAVAEYGVGVIDLYSALYKYSDPAPSVNLQSTSGGSSAVSLSNTDRGISYFGATPIRLSLRGVGRIYASAPPSTISGLWSMESDIQVEIQTVGRVPSIIKTFVGGRKVKGQPGQFEVPVLSATASKATVFNDISVPAVNSDGTYTPINLSSGQYKIVAKISLRNTTGVVSTTESSQFLTVTEKRLSAGRSMFSIPFKAGTFLRPSTDKDLTPEAALLGKTTVFSLARFNPLRAPSDDDYSRFRNTVDLFNVKGAARFDILDQLSSKIITYDTTSLGSSIAPIGLGYWLDLDRATGVSTTLLPYPSQIPGVSPIAENTVGINAYASGGGWNMIGAPFTYAVDWSVVTVMVENASYSMADAVKAGIISPALIGFANGDYLYAIAPSGQLEPFNGYWVRVFRDCTLLVPPVSSASSRKQTVNTSNDGWRARLIANVAGDVDGQNYFGQMRNAADTEDKNDILKPPAGAGHAYARFSGASSDGKSRSLAFDMRAMTGNVVNRQEWVTEVATDRPNANVVLSWDGIRSAPRNSRLVLRDTVTGERVVMNSRSSYTYRSGEPGSSRKFLITLEPQASGGNLAIRNMRTVQTTRASAGTGVSVRFNTNVEADIVGTIETLDGRPVGDLVGSGRSQSGADTTLRWDGRNKSGGLVAAGPYLVRVKARTADGQTQVEQRVIQIVR